MRGNSFANGNSGAGNSMNNGGGSPYSREWIGERPVSCWTFMEPEPYK